MDRDCIDVSGKQRNNEKSNITGQAANIWQGSSSQVFLTRYLDTLSIPLHDFEGSNSSFSRVKRLEFRLYENTSCQGIVGCTPCNVPLYKPYITWVFRG